MAARWAFYVVFAWAAKRAASLASSTAAYLASTHMVGRKGSMLGIQWVHSSAAMMVCKTVAMMDSLKVPLSVEVTVETRAELREICRVGWMDIAAAPWLVAQMVSMMASILVAWKAKSKVALKVLLLVARPAVVMA